MKNTDKEMTISDAIVEGTKIVTIGAGCLALGYLVAKMRTNRDLTIISLAQDSAYLRTKIAEAGLSGSANIKWVLKDGTTRDYVLKLVNEVAK